MPRVSRWTSGMGNDENLHWRALRSPRAVVEIEEISTGALVEDGRAAGCEGAVSTHGEARSEDRASLSGLVELELVVIRLLQFSR